ncbi:MAG: DUF5333 domain-containing protein [Marinosulfonomonas sp.]|nr:DUF5333 domain-containing protein [Marinosulfonomonas sp.]
MTYIRNTMTAALTVFAMTAANATALTPLPKEVHINYSLMSAKVADTIRKTCPGISARMFVVWNKANALKSYALKKGYTEAEVRAFLKNPKEKARVKATAADYLTSHGAVAGNAESYCTLGREEIAKKSLIGQMLRAR